MNTTKYIIILIFVFTIVVFGASQADAHAGNAASPRFELMRQMMGEQSLNIMEQMEEQMMGAKNHERMEELMDKFLAGSLSSDEQKEMTSIMQSANAGAMSMMMRMMVPQMMQNSGILRYGMMGYGWIGISWIFWITLILVWAVLILVIAALWRWIKKHP